MSLQRFLPPIVLILLISISFFSCTGSGGDNPVPPPSTNPPTILTIGTTAISTTSANSGGEITNVGGSPVIEKGVCYSTSPNPTTANSKVVATGTAVNFLVTINGLTANVVYYVRAYATNAAGTAYGNELSFRTSIVSNVITDPAVTMYVSGGHTKKLFALNASDGTIKWSVDLGGMVYSSPIYANGMVYVGCMDDKLYAYDTLGNLKWTVTVNAFYHECPLVANGMVYYPEDNAVSAFNAVTGALVWRTPGAGKNIVLKNNLLYSNNHHFYALNPLTGEIMWQRYTAQSGEPLVFADRIYVRTGSDSLNVINPSNGTTIWGKESISLFREATSMNMKHGNLYILKDAFHANYGSDGLNILDSATGNLKFPRTAFNGGSSVGDNYAPLFADSLAIVPANHLVYVFNAFTGAMLYQVPVGGSTVSGVTIVNDLLYVTQVLTGILNPADGSVRHSGFVHAFDYKTKTMRWSREFSNVSFILAAPCVVTQSGKVYRGGMFQ